MNKPALPPFAACLAEPDAALAAALQAALGDRATWEPVTAPQLRLLVLGGADALKDAAAYQGSASLLLLLDKPAPESCSHAVLVRPFRLGVFADIALRLGRRAPVIELGAGGRLYPQARQWETPAGGRIPLTEKEVDILAYLAGSGAPATREELLEQVWGYNQGVTTHTLETHIYRLRQKIESDPEAPAILKTDSDGAGYYVVAR